MKVWFGLVWLYEWGKDFDLKLFDHFEPALVPLHIEVGGKCDAVVLVVDSKHLCIRMKQSQMVLSNNRRILRGLGLIANSLAVQNGVLGEKGQKICKK